MDERERMYGRNKIQIFFVHGSCSKAYSPISKNKNAPLVQLIHRFSNLFGTDLLFLFLNAPLFANAKHTLHDLHTDQEFSQLNWMSGLAQKLVAKRKDTVLISLLLTIHCFTQTSGLSVNFRKSSFVPLAIPPPQYLPSIQQTLGCKCQSLPITYLGMPLSLRAPTREDYMPLLGKLESRLEGWKSRLISRARKLLLVKTVLSSILTYYMSCFSLPKWLLSRIDQIRRQFLWSKPQSTHPIHLLNWHSVCLPLANRGLGVPNLQLQNTSLLLRWWWRLYAVRGQLWSTYASLIYATRLPVNGPLILSPAGSFFWNSIIKIKLIFFSCAKFTIVSKQNTSFWFDPWSGQPLGANKPPPLRNRAISVSQAKSRFHKLLPGPLTIHQNEAFSLISSMVLTAGPDKVTWKLANSGSFSASFIYRVLSRGGKITSSFSFIWKTRVTPSMRLFTFFLLKNRLLTYDVMFRRQLQFTPGCVMCMRRESESPVHLFFQCPLAVKLWDTITSHLGYTAISVKDTALQTFLASSPLDTQARKTWMVYFTTATWSIWKERNGRTFRKHYTPHHVLLTNLFLDAALCLKYY